MKTLIASFLIFTATLAFADVAVYEGFQYGKTTPSISPGADGGRVFEVVDPASSQIVFISLTRKPAKTFSVGAPVSVVITAVQHSRGNGSSTVLAEASTSTNLTTGVTTVTSLFQSGRNAQVIISGTTATSLPRLLQSTSQTVSTAGTGTPPTIAPSLTGQDASLTLKVADSLISNNAGDTLSAAVTRITTALIAKGFTAAP